MQSNLRPKLVSAPLRRVTLPQLITASAAAVALGVSARTIRRRIADGSLPACRIRGRLYLRPEELRAFVERHREVSDD
ncbi:MAG: helix-turn-helix domain-containing protein [Acetobacteraceae bacterium]|nr:helix-turn-helix domain-containing protein [Acetobacteraceae bacterium]